MPTRALLLPLSLSVLCLVPSLALAQDATTPGEVATPHPTLEHIAIEWAIAGDADADGVVSVRYRAMGDTTFRDSIPLVRVPGGSNEGHTWANRHAGSLFRLSPDTLYEIELTLADPDGGAETRTVMARTRPVPNVPASARTIDATPSDVGSVIGGAMPGDVVVLAPGTYGTITVGNDGSEGMPIVVRGSAVDEVIVEGEVRMDGRAHVWIEDLTVRGQIKFNDATGIVVRGCRVEAMTATGDGIVSYGGGSTDGYFADNVVTGRTVWAEASLGVSGDNIGEGIAMTGPGNVIEHNRVVGFRDCISLLEDGSAREQISIDILDNDLDVCADDAIEADFAMGNVRVMRNRMTNSFIALSSQPSLGGPTWFVRNVIFNTIFQAFKPNRGSIGDLWLHNTLVKAGDAMGVYAGRTWSRAVFRNNLLIGGTGGGTWGGYSNGDGRVLAVADLDAASSDFDYDGYGSIGTGTFRGRFGGTSFASLDELRALTTEANAVEVDLGVFAATFDFPESPFPERVAPDLRLAGGTAAIDAGEPLPGLNDGFAGAAPDLGAYELGAPLVEYGPRSASPTCGNGVLEMGETCDDGNTSAGDGCSPACLSETDGGAPATDGGASASDGGGTSRDGGATDGGPAGSSDDGCGCRASGGSAGDAALLLVVAALLFARSRRRR